MCSMALFINICRIDSINRLGDVYDKGSFHAIIPRRKAFISTANKTLQTQLWEKDLPALRRIAPHPFSAALLKGRSNYVCLLRLSELSKQPQQLSLHDPNRLVNLMNDLEQVPSGDTENLANCASPILATSSVFPVLKSSETTGYLPPSSGLVKYRRSPAIWNLQSNIGGMSTLVAEPPAAGIFQSSTEPYAPLAMHNSPPSVETRAKAPPSFVT